VSYPKSTGRARPFRLWDAQAKRPMRWRCYKHRESGTIRATDSTRPPIETPEGMAAAQAAIAYASTVLRFDTSAQRALLFVESLLTPAASGSTGTTGAKL